MSNPYTSVTVSGYNANPPADDGTRVAANQLAWSKHKTKIGDPLKVAIEAINANALAAFAKTFANTFASKTSDYVVTTTDNGAFLSVTGTTTITLPPVLTAGSVFSITVLNVGTAVVTVDGDGAETINGAAALYLGPADSAIIVCSGAAWAALVTRTFPNRVQSKSSNYPVVASDVGSLLQFTAAATLTLPNVATAGHGFRLAVSALGTTAAVTISGDGTIDGDSSLVMYDGQTVELFCTGSVWVVTSIEVASEQIKTKTADESVTSSTTLQDDNHLTGFTLAAGALYEIKAHLVYESEVFQNAKVSLLLSQAEQRMAVDVLSGDNSSAMSLKSLNASGIVGTILGAGAGIILGASLNGTVRANATTGGTLGLQWAQLNSHGTPSTLYQGSWMRLRRIG